MRGAGLVHISWSKCISHHIYIYTDIFLYSSYMYTSSKTSRQRWETTNPDRWRFLAWISRKLGSLTWVCTTFEVRGVTYPVNIDMNMKWTKQDPWEIWGMNILKSFKNIGFFLWNLDFQFQLWGCLVSSCLWVANPANYTEISLGFTAFTEFLKRTVLWFIVCWSTIWPRWFGLKPLGNPKPRQVELRVIECCRLWCDY